MKPVIPDTDPPGGSARNTQPGLGQKRRLEETPEDKELREVRERINADPEALAALAAMREAQEKAPPLVVPISMLEEAREEAQKRQRARRGPVVAEADTKGVAAEGPAEGEEEPDAEPLPPETFVQLPATAPSDTTTRGPALVMGPKEPEEVVPAALETPDRRRVFAIGAFVVAVVAAVGIGWLSSGPGGAPTVPTAASSTPAGSTPTQTSTTAASAPSALPPSAPPLASVSSSSVPETSVPAPLKTAPSLQPASTPPRPTTPVPSVTTPYILEDN